MTSMMISKMRQAKKKLLRKKKRKKQAKILHPGMKQKKL
jgi:hypothetical protein